MKKSFLLSFLLAPMTIFAAPKIDKIEPQNWYAGMQDTHLQLMVYGKDIASAQVSTTDEVVKIDSVVALDSKNYLFVYLDLKDKQAGNIALQFAWGKKKQIVNYPILEREKAASERKGFTNADVLYMLMPDRFAKGKATNDNIKGMHAYTIDRSAHSLRHGGDLEGIRQHLDYFNELGVTALWFTPVLENNSPDRGEYSTYHGYATTDYYRVDPRFGTNEEYKQLIAEAHQNGLKVVMDMIFNHSGLEHPWLRDLPSHDWLNNQEYVSYDAKGNPVIADEMPITSYKLTPVLDPYASEFDKAETTQGWFVSTMPDLNQRNPHLMQYLIQNSIWWIEYSGIDGIRMDTYPYAYAEGMAQWMARLNAEYPHFNVVGETWVTQPPYTAAWQTGSKNVAQDSHLQSVMDFTFFENITQARDEDTDAWWKGLNRVYNGLVYDYLYPNPEMVMAFIENHDTDRFLGNGKDVKALKQAMALLLTINRIPQLYYGTELLMNGTKEITDGHVRKDFYGFSADDDKNAFTGKGLTEEEREMLAWTKRILNWRKGNEVISKGRQVQFIPYHGVYVVARMLDNKAVLTIANGTNEVAELDIARYKEVIGNTTKAVDILTGKSISLNSNLSLSPRETLVLELLISN